MSDKTIDLLLKSLSLQPEQWEIRLHIAELMNANGMHTDAAKLLQEYSPRPEEEPLLLQMGESLAKGAPDQALVLLDDVISSNKACAKAYRIKAEIYRERGMKAEARKQYNVAAVIDESFEDAEFEGWLDNKESESSDPMETVSEKPQQPIECKPIPLGNVHFGSAEIDDVPEEDDFIETDKFVDEALSSQIDHIDFSNIGGMEALKERIRMSIIYPFKNKELFEKFKKRRGGGLLFYGPPGCGKTLISRATAGECGAHFIDLSIHEVLSKWIGESEQRLHEIFKTARRKAPTILFIDEIDALGVKRSDAGHTATTVNTLLTEIDGASSKNEDILVIGATNTPWRVDSAFRRPGRFDHVLFVPPPDAEARASIFEVVLEGIPQEKLNIQQLAKATHDFSGADIKAAVEGASEKVIEAIMKTGKDAKLSQKDLLAVIKKMRPTTLEWLEQASNYASYSNQSGLYDDLVEYLGRR